MDLLGLKNEANEEVPQSCILSIGQPNQLLWLQKGVWLYESWWENEPTSHLIYYLREQLPNKFMVSVTFSSLFFQYDMMGNLLVMAPFGVE